jgi:hypothetical protein
MYIMTIYNKSRASSFVQIIPLATHWIRMLSFLQPVEHRQDMDTGCNLLETVAQGLTTSAPGCLTTGYHVDA